MTRLHRSNNGLLAQELVSWQQTSKYEGHLRINYNEFISPKVLLYSVLFIVPHWDTDITYSCLKFGAFIMA